MIHRTAITFSSYLFHTRPYLEQEDDSYKSRQGYFVVMPLYSAKPGHPPPLAPHPQQRLTLLVIYEQYAEAMELGCREHFVSLRSFCNDELVAFLLAKIPLRRYSASFHLSLLSFGGQ